jgi:hypothetical protein
VMLRSSSAASDRPGAERARGLLGQVGLGSDSGTRGAVGWGTAAVGWRGRWSASRRPACRRADGEPGQQDRGGGLRTPPADQSRGSPHQRDRHAQPGAGQPDRPHPPDAGRADAGVGSRPGALRPEKFGPSRRPDRRL